jgi:PAS domain S-box-containing protein
MKFSQILGGSSQKLLRWLRGSNFSKNALNAFFASAPAGIAILDSQLRIRKANLTMADMIGTPLAALLGSTPRGVAPLFADKIEPFLRRVSATGKGVLNFPVIGETVKSPGVIRQWLASVSPICPEPEGMWCIGVIAVEVTEAARFEKLRKSEALLAEAEQLGQLGSWERDLVTGEETWSANLCRLLAIDPVQTTVSEELFWDLVHYDDREGVRMVVDSAMKFADAYEVQSRFTLPGGRERTFYTRGKLVLDPNNQVIKRMGLTQDITARVEMEHALQRSEATIRRERDRAQRYLDIADVILLALDLQGRITMINRMGCATLEREEHQLLGCDWITTCVPARTRRFVKPWFDNLLAGDLSYVENLIVTRSGEERLIGWRNTLLKDDEGRVIGTLSSGEDITERKVAEKAVQQLSSLLLRAQDDERRRIAKEVHDGIGQYIAGLSLAIGRLRTSCIDETDPDSRQTLADCRTLIHRASQEIRTISYLLHPPTIDELGLKSALEWLVNGYGERWGLQVSLEVSATLGRLKPEIELTLFRIAQESLINIHRHSQSPTALVRLFQRPDEIVLEVADRGKGMPARTRESERSSGIGILAIEERVKQWKGHFNLESSPDKGVTIHVTLPVT